MLKATLRIAMLIALVLGVTPGFSQSEEDLDKWMKTVGKTMGELRKANEAKDEAALKAGGATLVEMFTNAGKFFAKNKMEDAVALNAKTLDAAKALAAGTGDMRSVGSTCKGCHDIYREQLEDKTYKLKMTH